MRSKAKLADNPEIDISFTKENHNMNRQQSRLKVEILRVHTIEKHRGNIQIWQMTQNQLCEYFTMYKLFPQKGMTIDELLDSNKLKLIKSDGKIYFGEVDRKRREGRGIYLQKEGKIFEGQFYNNEKNGNGVEIYPNGNLYVGQFQNNKKHGQGIFYWFNLSSRSPKSEEPVQYYQGLWWGGLPDGQGMHQKVNGDSYTGGFKNGLKHGEGTEFYGNGDYYKGEFINGMPEGYGQYLWADGSSYKGDFKQSQRSGYGLWEASKKRAESYKGHYLNDKKTGYGVYTWDNGWSYRGNFDNDFRNGYGELYNSQGELSYKGFWQNGDQTEKEVTVGSHEKQINFKTVQFSRYEGKRQQNNSRLENAQTKSRSSVKLHMNKQDIGEYATISNFGQSNMCKRPENFTGNSRIRKSSSMVSRGIRFKQNGRIGTTINRPLMQPNTFSQRNYSSTRRF